jgi:hypothetical protein
LSYPPFAPPEELARIRHEQWSSQQAQAYAAWFHSVSDARIAGLLAYFGEKGRVIDEDLIRDLGEHLKRTLPQPQFSAPSVHGPELTNQGYGLAADMGLLGAKWLRNQYPRLQWSIIRKPKSDISYNFPVLIGFGKMPLDPVLVSINQAHGLLAGNRDSDAWLHVWNRWGALAKEQAPPSYPQTSANQGLYNDSDSERAHRDVMKDSGERCWSLRTSRWGW